MDNTLSAGTVCGGGGGAGVAAGSDGTLNNDSGIENCSAIDAVFQQQSTATATATTTAAAAAAHVATQNVPLTSLDEHKRWSKCNRLQQHCNDDLLNGGSVADDCQRRSIDLQPYEAVETSPSSDYEYGGGDEDEDDDDNNRSVISSSSSAAAAAAPVYNEIVDGGRGRQAAPTLDVINRQGSQSSTKTCEVDCGDEERDTFSPVTSNSNSPSEPLHPVSSAPDTRLPPPPAGFGGSSSSSSSSEGAPAVAGISVVAEGAADVCNGSCQLVDNKIFDDKQQQQQQQLQHNNMKSTPLSTTKEEKQRQNEEIVIMETSSISSETGSWESIFPHHAPMVANTSPSIEAADMTTCCTEFLQNERKEQLKPMERPTNKHRERTISSSSSVVVAVAAAAAAAVGSTACFIDASSLRDEDEVLSFPSLEGHQSVDGGDEGEQQDVNDDPISAQLETFHKAFKMCKTKAAEESPAAVVANAFPPPQTTTNGDSSNSSSCSGDSPHKEANNLSDEEKLWKRENSKKLRHHSKHNVKDQYDKDGPVDEHRNLFADSPPHDNGGGDPSAGLAAADLDSSDSSEVVKLRRQQERKQGSFIFQHNIQQFSGHMISPKLPFPASDISYTTDYSSSSPAPSLVWSDHERSSRPSGLDDFDGGGGGVSGGGGGRKSCLLPDTPHNSIVHIEAPSLSSSIHKDYTSSQQRDSGAYCSDATDSPIMMPRTPKRTKFDEANPIVSGGASIKDFNVKQCESPPVKRRTETCPIVSGGFMSLDFEPSLHVGDRDDEEFRVKTKLRKPISSAVTSWVVDMSDCKGDRRRSNSSSSSTDNTAAASIERSGSAAVSYQRSGLGFYVSLNDMDASHPAITTTAVTNSRNKIFEKKSTGFYVDMSESEASRTATPPPPVVSDSVVQTEINGTPPATDKKNLFSMFIDFGSGCGDKKSGSSSNSSTKKEPFSLAARLCSSFTQKKNDDLMKASNSSTETLMSRSNIFQRNTESESTTEANPTADSKYDMEPPITVAAIRRISEQRNLAAAESKRHSWSNNNSTTNSGNDGGGDYKRSMSLTADKGLMHIIDKIPLISKTSSMSIDSSLCPFDDFTCSKSEISTYSNNSTSSVSGGENNLAEMAGSNGNVNGVGSHIPVATAKLKKRRKDVQINETFDKSSVGSLTDGVLSKDLSPTSTTDTDDLTFQQDEELAKELLLREENNVNVQPLALTQQLLQQTSTRSLIMETIIETKETASPKKTSNPEHTLESLHATIEKQKQLLETVTEHAETNSITTNISTAMFVKLSDMDKPVTKFELHSPEALMSKSVGNHRQINRLFRDETRTRPHSWTMTRSTGNSFLNITNSVENLRSLSRLFPNFSKEFSNSLPNDMILDNNCQQIGGSIEYVQSDMSADSSLASSFSRSGMDESSISCRQPRRLGEDLLKMFLQEIATDMMVEVNGRRIKAHKCILRSRCQYFAAVLAGGWAQTSGNVVSLPGYSYSAVHFALCHIYSGASHPPDGISLMELAALADLLGLEGLKEVTAHALKTNYCHNFHKPCSGCIDGILQVLPVALNHALDDLYRKCLRWTCRHYLKVWPTRQFAQLPPDILGRCRQQIVAYLSSETVLDAVLDCDNLLAQLAPFRWGGISENLVRDIMDAAYGYIADHFATLIASDSFLSLGHDKSCHIARLEGILLRTASSLTPDQACRSYQRVTRLNTVLQAKVIKMPTDLGELAKELQGLQEEDLDWNPEYIRLVSAILSAVEQCLTRQCSRAMRVAAWQRMDLDLRKKIQTLARLTEPLDLRRGKTVAKAFSFGGSTTRNQDLYQVKLAIQAHSKRALAQDTQLYKATTNHVQTQATLQDSNNIQTIEKGVQANHDLKEGTSKVLKTNSRAHVPQQTIINKTTSGTAAVPLPSSSSEKGNSSGHRRTQSEAPLSTVSRNKQLPIKVASASAIAPAQASIKSAGVRHIDVRPRYLEPRKPRAITNGTGGPVRSQTSSSIPSKGKRHISSSDSSRNSSPAARKNAANAERKIGTKSINMSLDSLASPSRRTSNKNKGKSSEDGGDRYSDICIDSLADSMKSSMITDKTISQESLTSGCGKLFRSNAVIMNNKLLRAQQQEQLQQQQQQNNKTNSNLQTKTKPPLAANRSSKKQIYCQQQKIASAASSPSSTTTKSASRLSSVSSTNSPRDAFKHRSISVPGNDSSAVSQPTPTTVRRSFLSAKSREILARRAEKNKQQPASSCDEKSVSATISINRTITTANTLMNRNSMSNIPTRRPNSLHLKKSTISTVGKVQTAQSQINNNHHHNVALSSKSKEAGKSVTAHNGVADKWAKNKIELLIESPSTVQKSRMLEQQRIETKLERSSTFCKESSDLDVNELQIIE